MLEQGRTRRSRMYGKGAFGPGSERRYLNTGPVIENLEDRLLLSAYAQISSDPPPLPRQQAQYDLISGTLPAPISAVPVQWAGRITEQYWKAIESVADRGSNGLSSLVPDEDRLTARINTEGAIDTYIHVSTWRTTLRGDVEAVLGARIESSNQQMRVIQAWIAPQAVDRILGLPGVDHLDLPTYAVADNEGAYGTIGDGIMRAEDVRNRFAALEIDGTGIRIGVISNGANNRAAAQLTQDLPNVITIAPNHPGWGDEGTAMMEIVHDLAPGADLYFSGPTTAAAMIDAIAWMEGQGVDVIVDDLNFYDERLCRKAAIAQE